MIVISEWMSKHLEEKAIAREKRHLERSKEMIKHNWTSREEYIEDAKKTDLSKHKKLVQFCDDQYQKFKAEYEAKKIRNQKK